MTSKPNILYAMTSLPKALNFKELVPDARDHRLQRLVGTAQDTKETAQKTFG